MEKVKTCCPNCQSRYKVRLEHLNERRRCPGCRQPFLIQETPTSSHQSKEIIQVPSRNNGPESAVDVEITVVPALATRNSLVTEPESLAPDFRTWLVVLPLICGGMNWLDKLTKSTIEPATWQLNFS
jgi:hypothetical protein